MPRYLVQSQASGRFLVPSASGDEPVWIRSLREAGGGVVADLEQITQIVQDNCDPEHRPVVVDLDRLGTFNDYVGS